MEIRFLATDEYDLLDRIPEPYRAKLTPNMAPLVATAMVDGEVKGRLCVMMLPHIEGVWIAPEIRCGIAGARMEALIVRKLKELGASIVVAYAPNTEIEGYLQRLGYQKEGLTVWKKEL